MRRKNVLAMALVTALTLQLVGCGGGASSGSTKSTSGATVLTIPTYYTGENVGAEYFEGAVQRFNEANAGVYEVKIESVVEADCEEKMSQLAQNNKLPVLLCGVSDTWIDNRIAKNNLYYPMNDFLDENPDIKALCLDESIERSTQENGDIIGIPAVAISPMGSFYNTELYHPETDIVKMSVDEFISSMGDNKIAFQTVDNAWTSMLFLTSLIANEEGGAELLNEYDGTILYDYNKPCIVNAVTKLTEIWANNASSNAVGAAYADAANSFFSNNSAVICNGSWMNSEFSESGAGNWSNGFNGANVKADYYPGNIAICNQKIYGRWIMTNSGSEEERAAGFAFLKFLYSQDELETWLSIEGGQCPNMEYSDEFLTKLEQNEIIRAQIELIGEDTTIVPAFNEIMPTSVADNNFGTELIQLVNGKITPEQFCQNLTQYAEETR